jgi:hypothetical protein
MNRYYQVDGDRKHAKIDEQNKTGKLSKVVLFFHPHVTHPQHRSIVQDKVMEVAMFCLILL